MRQAQAKGKSNICDPAINDVNFSEQISGVITILLTIQSVWSSKTAAPGSEGKKSCFVKWSAEERLPLLISEQSYCITFLKCSTSFWVTILPANYQIFIANNFCGCKSNDAETELRDTLAWSPCWPRYHIFEGVRTPYVRLGLLQVRSANTCLPYQEVRNVTLNLEVSRELKIIS